MIVLDEQLLGRGIEDEIAQWYPGSVRFIIDLRPNTIVKDEAIAGLLGQQASPTFVTINDRDFWQETTASARFCIICFPLPDSHVRQIPALLRVLLRRPEFRTKAARRGKVIRVTQGQIQYFTHSDRQVKTIP